MRKLVVYVLTSLDGAVEDPRRYFPASTPDVPSPPQLDATLDGLEAELIGRQDAVLMGRTTFDEWSRYWPASDVQPFADFINGVAKYVVTSTPLGTEWNNVEAVSAPIADVVRDLKARPGMDIGVHASIRLARSLLAAELVDELQLAVGPVLDPVGPRLFEGLDGLRSLELIRSVSTPTGALWLTYRPLPG
jgi:dihydrofolate reductase